MALLSSMSDKEHYDFNIASSLPTCPKPKADISLFIPRHIFTYHFKQMEEQRNAIDYKSISCSMQHSRMPKRKVRLKEVGGK